MSACTICPDLTVWTAEPLPHSATLLELQLAVHAHHEAAQPRTMSRARRALIWSPLPLAGAVLVTLIHDPAAWGLDAVLAGIVAVVAGPLHNG